MLSFLLKLVLPALAFGCGLYAAHRWDEGDIEALHAKIATIARDDARANAVAIADAADRVKRADALSLNAAVAEAAAQQKLADEKSRTLEEVRLHVSSAARLCIPYGLVRLLDAASLGADPNSLSLPSGRSDAACAPVNAADLAANVAANYAVARENAEQLNALAAWNNAQASASAAH
jgi:hypothetical protein